MLFCAYARKLGRNLLILYSKNVVNKSFTALANQKTKFINLTWCLDVGLRVIIRFKIFLRSCMYYFISYLKSSKKLNLNDRYAGIRDFSHAGTVFSASQAAPMKRGVQKWWDFYQQFLISAHGKAFSNYFDMPLFIEHYRPLYVRCEDKGNKLLENIGLKDTDWFVCLHARESSYLGDAFREWQNQDINKYIEAIKYIASLGGYVIRMGDKSMRPIPDVKNFVDYAHSGYKCDFGDLYLSSKAKFAIVNNSGYRALPQLFGVPLLTVNQYPVTPMDIYDRSLIIYKKVFCQAVGRQLSLREILSDDKLCHFNTDNEYEKAGLRIEENSPREILDAVVEMLKLVDNNSWDEWDDWQKGFQREIQICLKDSDHLYGYGKTMFYPDGFCRIGSKYVRENWK